MKLAVMGCIVNGPGESKHANIGISLPGTFEDPKAPVFIDGRLVTTLKGDHIVEEFKHILSEYVEISTRRKRRRRSSRNASCTISSAEPAWFRVSFALKVGHDEDPEDGVS